MAWWRRRRKVWALEVDDIGVRKTADGDVVESTDNRSFVCWVRPATS